jgi:histidinol dehydrogenase
MTVEEIVKRPFEVQCAKHGTPEPDECINRLTNAELLRAISEAVEQRIADRENERG